MTKRITNLQALTSGVAVVFAFLFMHFAPDLSPVQRFGMYVGLLGGGWLFGFAMTKLQTVLRAESVWRRDVTDKLAFAVINGVMFLAFCLVCVLAYVMTKGYDAVHASILLGTLVVFGVGIGTLLRRRFSQRIALSYGLGFFIAVMPTLLIALTFKRQ